MKMKASATTWIVIMTASLGLAGAAKAEVLCGANAGVEPGTVIVIGLATGDTLVVTFADCDGTTAIVDHQLLGRLELPSTAVAEVVAGKPGEDLVLDVRVFTDGDAPEPAPAPEGIASVDAAVVTDDDLDVPAEPKKRLWESQAEFGLNGSEGNSERLSVRLGARSKRTAERKELTLDALYTRSDEATDGNSRETTEHKATVKGLNDWLFPESPWRYFVGGSAEYDEFQSYDARVSVSTGPGYAFIDNDTTKLIGRTGIGTSWKLGGEEDDGYFELVFGYNFEHALTEHQKIVSSAAIFPNMTETGDYRAVAILAYDVTLAVPAALSLRLGIEDRYDSTIKDIDNADGTTDEFDKNDLDYYAALIWDF